MQGSEVPSYTSISTKYIGQNISIRTNTKFDFYYNQNLEIRI
jgi:hypothetical protein